MVTPISTPDTNWQEKLRERFEAHKNEIQSCLNLKELVPLLLCEKYLLSNKEGNSILKQSHIDERGTELLYQKISNVRGYSKFLNCLEKEKEHFGHAYIASLLRGQEYAPKSEVACSKSVQESVREHFTAFVEGVNLTELVPHMYQKGLLTAHERDELSNSQHSYKERIVSLFGTLDSKGPLAYCHFAECLKDEKNHRTHSELYSIISGHFCQRKQTQSSRKHPHNDDDDLEPTPVALLSLCKRRSCRLQPHGPLTGQKYDALMSTFQTYHHNGEWERLQQEARKYMSTGTPYELQVVALLELAVSWIFQQDETNAVSCISKAKEKCKLLAGHGDNYVFLQGRCEYIFSRLYRYLKQNFRAKEHATNAKQILFNVEPGEDTAFANYCDACVSVESLIDPSIQEINEVERCFQVAICDARNHNSGLDLVAPHSFMRLAQMYLRSGHYIPGSLRDQDSVRKAADCLKSVCVQNLSLRSRCHFRLIESDLYWNKGMLSKSTAAAQSVLETSKRHNFTNEIVSAENRLSSRALMAL